MKLNAEERALMHKVHIIAVVIHNDTLARFADQALHGGTNTAAQRFEHKRAVQACTTFMARLIQSAVAAEEA